MEIMVMDMNVVDTSLNISFIMASMVGDAKSGINCMASLMASSESIGRNLARVNKNIKKGNSEISVKKAAWAEKDAT